MHSSYGIGMLVLKHTSLVVDWISEMTVAES